MSFLINFQKINVVTTNQMKKDVGSSSNGLHPLQKAMIGVSTNVKTGPVILFADEFKEDFPALNK
jgi:hypothetical protein